MINIFEYFSTLKQLCLVAETIKELFSVMFALNNPLLPWGILPKNINLMEFFPPLPLLKCHKSVRGRF